MSNTTTQNKSSLSNRVAWLVVANVASFAISFLAPLIVVRILDQTQFGTYKQVFQILTTLLGVFYLQVPPSIYYFSERLPAKRLQIALNVIFFYLAIGIAIATIFVIYPGWAKYIFQNAEIVSYIPLLGITFVFWLASNNLEAIPISNNDVRAASIIIIIGQITRSIFIIIAALLFKNTKAILYASMCAGAVQMSVLLAYIHFRLGSLWRHPKHLLDWEIFGKQMSNSLPYAGGGFAANIQTDLHNYIVSYYYSPAMFAVYANGCFQIPLLTLLQSAFREAITPDVARLSASGDYTEMRRAWLVAMRKLSFFIFPAFAIMFLLRTELITTLFTKAYAESIPIFTVYLLNILFLTLIISPYVRMFPEFKTFFLSFQIVLVPFTGLILYLTIHRAGLVGVVAAMVAIQTFSYIVYLRKISRRIGVTREDLSLLTPVGSIILATLVAGLASSVAKTFCSTFPTIILMGLCGIIFGVIYLVVAFISGAISPEEKAEIYSKIRSVQYKFRPSETKLSARLDP